MKIYPYIVLLFFVLSCSAVSGQIDSTQEFKEAEGFLPYPIEKVSSVIYAGQIHQACVPIIQTTFIADSSCEVNAVYDGTVLSITQIDSAYLVITKYGDYYLVYFGLDKPVVKKYQFIKCGQQIASAIYKDEIFNNYQVEIQLVFATEQTSNTKSNFQYLNPDKWFRKENDEQRCKSDIDKSPLFSQIGKLAQ